MRFVKCFSVIAVVTTLAASPALAQDTAFAPAGLPRQVASTPLWHSAHDSSHTSLRVHMVRGSEIGGIAGLALSGLALVAISRDQCPNFAPSTPALGGGCSNLSTGKSVQILVGGAAAGAVIGSVLGYAYHVNGNEERARRCRANPSACP